MATHRPELRPTTKFTIKRTLDGHIQPYLAHGDIEDDYSNPHDPDDYVTP